MPKQLTIDFVSDIVCPWCVIGLRGLEQAIDAIGDDVDATVRFQPFELNPAMPAEGQNVREHIAQKYGASPEQSAATRALIRDRAADVGFVMNSGADSRIYNSFDAHRLLHWADHDCDDPQAAARLKHALFAAYFTDGANIADHAVLMAAVEAAGLDAIAAAALLASGRYADDVRGIEAYWRREGVNAVPAAIINGRYVISGGQAPDKYERALRSIMAEA